MVSQENKMKIGVYAGTFDPITNGHINIIKRSLKIVDVLYIAIAADSLKNSLFSIEERVAMINQEIDTYKIPKDNIKLEVFSGLLVNFAKEKNISILIRGLRTVSDFEYEYQMACVNSLLNSEMQTIFLPAEQELQLVSSKFAKEIIKLGGDSKYFLSENVKKQLAKKFKE